MPQVIRAIVTPQILIWARERLRLSVSDAVAKTGFEQPAIQSWESGNSRPTIKQARYMAKSYKLPFAALFLPEPPEAPIRLPHDYRRIAGTSLGEIDSEIIYVVQDAWNYRDIALELYELAKTSPRSVRRVLNLQDDPETTGNSLRQALGISLSNQHQWHNSRLAFNTWREVIEDQGVLVFQQSKIELERLRGFSLDARPLPVVMINRNDGYASRAFTLLHEFVHILLRNDGLCDLLTSRNRPPEEQRLEIYCNAVAAACLMPATELLRHRLLNVSRALTQWTDDEIKELASVFSVSREALLRRLLTLGRTSQPFYEQKRAQYITEARTRIRQTGYAPPAIETLSRLGKPFVRLVMGGYNNKSLTSSEASEFLGIRAKHFPMLIDSIGVN